MRAIDNLEVADGLADDRRIGHAGELDQVEVAVVVENHAGRTGAADRLDVSLDVDQGRAGQIRAERLAQGGKKIRVVERERAERGPDRFVPLERRPRARGFDRCSRGPHLAASEWAEQSEQSHKLRSA